MRILHLNIRLTEGGAGRVAYDLSQRLNLLGHDSAFWYGYAGGIADDPNDHNRPKIERISNRLSVMANFAVHRIVGRDILTPRQSDLYSAMRDVDVVHIHTLHHYYLNGHAVLKYLAKIGKPTVVTIHDWWFVTGRCAFVGSCQSWLESCGKCDEFGQTDHLPSHFDFSRRWQAERRFLIEQLSDTLIFVAPSEHIARDFRLALPRQRVRLIRNTYDLSFERIIEERHEFQPRDIEGAFLLVVAADLSFAGKTDAGFVAEVHRLSGLKLVTVGANSPFSGPDVENLGYIADREELIRLFRTSTALLYSSTVDNAPLTLIEAAIVGTPIISLASPAADEIVGALGDRTYTDPQSAATRIDELARMSTREWERAAAASSERAATAFGSKRWVEDYLGIYHEVMDGAA